jgi:glycosyltransferase involved in cell wall biosynthesis
MIIVNARFLTQPITGVQRYAVEMSRVLKKLDPAIRFVAPHDILHHAIAQELGVIKVGSTRGHLWEQLELPRYLRSIGSPLLISLATTAPVLYRRKIVTVHDLAFKRFPDAVSWKFRLYYSLLIPRVLRSALHVTTVSQYSKQDICSEYALAESDVSVIHNASSFAPGGAARATDKQKLIIAVGSIQPYKNIDKLVTAFSKFKETSDPDYVLKLVGGADARVFSDTRLGQAMAGRADVQFTGYLSDADLLALYETATCFVFPSLFEGFGIPPLEAMACGCPVIASTAASIPEVCAQAALYCDPRDADDIAARMTQLTADPQLQARLIQLGFENIRRFSWEESGAAMLAIAGRFG